jgi:hypothetical protein
MFPAALILIVSSSSIFYFAFKLNYHFVLLRHRLICLHQLFFDPIELIQLLRLLIPLLPYHPKLVSHLLYLYSHLSIFSSEFNILTL